MKVYELAKDLGVESMSLLDTLKKSGVLVRSHMSSLNSNEVSQVKEYISSQIKTTKKSKVKKKLQKEASKSTLVAKSIVKKKIIKRRVSVEKPDIEAEEKKLGIPETLKVEVRPEASKRTKNMDPAIAIKAELEKAALKEKADSSKTKEKKPTEELKSKKDAFLRDEMLDESFTKGSLKIVKDSQPEKDTKSYKNAPAFAPEPTPSRERSESSVKGMFKPASSVLLDREEEYKRRTSNLDKFDKEQHTRITDFRKREIIFQPKKRKIPAGKALKKTLLTTPRQQKRRIRVEDKVTLMDFANRMKQKPKLLIDKVKELGLESPNTNTLLDFDVLQLLATEFNYEVENFSFNEESILKQEEKKEDMEARPPIIAVMGHVDHGKTTLLDKIRNSSVAEKEAGNITQHMSSYSVSIDGFDLTFIDTPGHEAFDIMRERGARVTDIVILVVAANDGVMSQTKEVIRHVQKAGSSTLLALNKIDIPDINIELIKKELSANNVLVEEWGGDVPLVQISALKGTGIKELLETLKVQAEVLELKASPKSLARGILLESSIKKGRGLVSDVLVMSGTLKLGDNIVCGTSYGKVKSIQDDRGRKVVKVKPGYAANFIGLNSLASAEQSFYVVSNEADAKAIVEHRKEKLRTENIVARKEEMSLDELFVAQEETGKKVLNIILKADTFGSLEAIEDTIIKNQSDKIDIKIISKSIGMIVESDAILAHTSNAYIFGFNVKADKAAKLLISMKSIPVHIKSVIYKLMDELKEAMESMLEPIRLEKAMGKAEVKQAFSISKVNKIAGSLVLNGKITRDAFIRVYRDGEKRTEGFVTSLKRFKDDAKEVLEGQECGIGVENYVDIAEGDIVEAFIVEYEKVKL